MSLFADDAYLAADFVELPCEFCSELYPIDLLMEHQSGCRPDLLHFNYDDAAPIASSATIPPKAPTSPKVKEVAQKNLNSLKTALPPPIVKDTNKTGNTIGNQNKDPFEDLLKDDDDEIPMVFEDSSQESGVKLMSYGSSIGKRIEEEKPSFKPPPSPLFNDQDKTMDTSGIISDDDEGGESLEDFWRRADIKNTQRLRKLKT